MKSKLAIIFSLAFLLVLGWVGAASAHISNEQEIYKDLGDSPAKEEITKLRALGIIGAIEGEENFEPKSELDKETLAFWLAKAANLEGHTEQPTPEEYALEAIEYGYLDNIKGIATYADVTAGILKIIGVKEVEKPAEQAEELGILEGEWHDLVDAGGNATKENAVLLFDMALDKKGPSGKSIATIMGVKDGPTGAVEDVKEEKVTVDGEEKESYKLMIGGKEIPFYGEGKIALYENILAAKGQKVVQSYIKTIEEEGKPPVEMLVFIQGEGNNGNTVPAAGTEQDEITEEQAPAAVNADEANEEEAAEETAALAEEAEEGGPSVGTVWTVVIIILMGISIGIYASGRKKA